MGSTIINIPKCVIYIHLYKLPQLKAMNQAPTERFSAKLKKTALKTSIPFLQVREELRCSDTRVLLHQKMMILRIRVINSAPILKKVLNLSKCAFPCFPLGKAHLNLY